MKEKFLGEFEVNVKVDWGKPVEIWEGEGYVERRALDYPEGFLARLLISESRVFLITEFTEEFKMGILAPVISGVEKKQRSLYMELALDKLEKYSFGMVKNTILFKPHGRLGKTIIEFKNLPGKMKKEIAESLEKARALKRKALNAGILVSDRPIREIYEERIKIIETQRLETPTQEVTEESEPEEISIPLATAETIPKMEPVPAEEPKITEPAEPIPELQQEPTEKIDVTEPSVPIEEIESANSERKELEVKYKKRLEKIWKSLIPRETICPYCKKRVLTIDRECPDCGAINL
ncbi:MAG: hypothetical protein ACETWM_21555 [Candidatus Lokiarchaeia archaeon]